jgi:hypothetical protein
MGEKKPVRNTFLKALTEALVDPAGAENPGEGIDDGFLSMDPGEAVFLTCSDRGPLKKRSRIKSQR